MKFLLLRAYTLTQIQLILSFDCSVLTTGTAVMAVKRNLEAEKREKPHAEKRRGLAENAEELRVFVLNYGFFVNEKRLIPSFSG